MRKEIQPYDIVIAASTHHDACDPHCTAWNQPHILQKLDVNFVVTEKIQLTNYSEHHWRPVSRVHMSLKVQMVFHYVPYLVMDVALAVAYQGIFSREGGSSPNSVEGRENGDLGVVAP
jgi:hypothetical protein